MFVKPTAATFEVEGEAMQLARRKRNWIGDVEFVKGGVQQGYIAASMQTGLQKG